MLLCAISLSTFFATAGQAIRVVKTGKDTANASQILQQRMETFHATSQWSSLTTPSGLATLFAPATDSASNLPGASETLTVVAYPSAGTPIIVSRNGSGAVTSTGSTLAAQSCVKVTVQVTWKGLGSLSRSRQLSTILTRGGF